MLLGEWLKYSFQLLCVFLTAASFDLVSRLFNSVKSCFCTENWFISLFLYTSRPTGAICKVLPIFCERPWHWRSHTARIFLAHEGQNKARWKWASTSTVLGCRLRVSAGIFRHEVHKLDEWTSDINGDVTDTFSVLIGQLDCRSFSAFASYTDIEDLVRRLVHTCNLVAGFGCLSGYDCIEIHQK